MRITGLVLLTVLLVSGCSQKKKISGPEYVKRDVLVNVISDIYIMNGITNDMSFYRKYNPNDSIDLYSSIFDKYNIDSKKYEKTINEYSKYPKLLDNVYNEVMMHLQQIQDSLDTSKSMD